MYEFDYTASEVEQQASVEQFLQAILDDEDIKISLPLPDDAKTEFFLYYLGTIDPDLAENYSLAFMYKELDAYIEGAEQKKPTFEDHERALTIVRQLRELQLPGVIEDCSVVADIVEDSLPALWHETYRRPADDGSNLLRYDDFILRNLARDDIRAKAAERSTDRTVVTRAMIDTAEQRRYRIAEHLIPLNIYLADKGFEVAKQRLLEAHINLMQTTNYLLSIDGYLDITHVHSILEKSDRALQQYGLDHPQLPELERTMFEGMAKRSTDPDRAMRVTALTTLDRLRKLYPDERAYKKLAKRVRAAYTILNISRPYRTVTPEEESLVRRITGDLRMPPVLDSDLDLLTEVMAKSNTTADH